jgi:N-acetylmuramoyl-L-alanine amidase
MAKRRIKKKVKVIIVCFLLLVITAVAISSTLYYFWWQDQQPQENVIFNDAYGVPVITELIPEGTRARQGIKRRIKYIVIHETDNYASSAGAKNHSQFLLTNPDGNSWHYTVDENEIYHHVPDNEIALHAGDSEGNKYGIGIEICVNKGADYEKAVENTAKLTARLLKAYDLPISAVKQHYDFNGKDCPHLLRLDDHMDEFLELVKKYLNED